MQCTTKSSMINVVGTTKSSMINVIGHKEAFKRAVACVCSVQLKHVIAPAKPLRCLFKHVRGLTKPMLGRMSTMSPPRY
jgi:hypothetical protein